MGLCDHGLDCWVFVSDRLCARGIERETDFQVLVGRRASEVGSLELAESLCGQSGCHICAFESRHWIGGKRQRWVGDHSVICVSSHWGSPHAVRGKRVCSLKLQSRRASLKNLQSRLQVFKKQTPKITTKDFCFLKTCSRDYCFKKQIQNSH